MDYDGMNEHQLTHLGTIRFRRMFLRIFAVAFISLGRMAGRSDVLAGSGRLTAFPAWGGQRCRRHGRATDELAFSSDRSATLRST